VVAEEDGRMSRELPMIVSAVALCGAACALVQPPAPAPAAVKQQWEYKVVSATALVDWQLVERGGKEGAVRRAENLNRLGSEGWDLVAIHQQERTPATSYVKRPK
jgi:hypothetical protein